MFINDEIIDKSVELVNEGTTLDRIAEIMIERRRDFIGIFSGKKISNIICSKNLVRLAYNLNERLSNLTAADIYYRALSLSYRDTLKSIARKMMKSHIYAGLLEDVAPITAYSLLRGLIKKTYLELADDVSQKAVVSLHLNQPIKYALLAILTNDQNVIPVFDSEGKLRKVMTAIDVLHAMINNDLESPLNEPAYGIEEVEPWIADPNLTLSSLVRLMIRRDVYGILLFDDGITKLENLRGFVTYEDIINAYAKVRRVFVHMRVDPSNLEEVVNVLYRTEGVKGVYLSSGSTNLIAVIDLGVSEDNLLSVLKPVLDKVIDYTIYSEVD